MPSLCGPAAPRCVLMAGRREPWWLSRPTRFAGLSRPRARLMLVLLAAFLAVTLTALATPGPPPVNHDPATDRADVILYAAIVDGMRAGGNYYAVAADALRMGGYPLKPFVTFRLPTLALVEAWLPRPLVLALLYLLDAVVMVAWGLRLRAAFRRTPPLLIALVLLAGGMAVFVQPDLVAFHEIWAGPLVALSLAVRRPGRWMEAVTIGLIAMLVRETAALYVAIMALLAWLDGERREALGWAGAMTVFAVVVAFHAHAVAAVVGPLDPESPGWAGMLGFGFFVKAMTLSTALLIVPAAIGAILVGLALFGWAAWADPLGLRTLTVVVAYASLLALFGRADTFYWVWMVAPAFLVGLAFAPDGLRDLAARALDRRRITVTRVER